jgi:hypothetical protein
MTANIIWKTTNTMGEMVRAESPGMAWLSMWASPAKWRVPMKPTPPQSLPKARL